MLDNVNKINVKRNSDLPLLPNKHMWFIKLRTIHSLPVAKETNSLEVTSGDRSLSCWDPVYVKVTWLEGKFPPTERACKFMYKVKFVSSYTLRCRKSIRHQACSLGFKIVSSAHEFLLLPMHTPPPSSAGKQRSIIHYGLIYFPVFFHSF